MFLIPNFLCILIILSSFIPTPHGKKQYVQPLNMGMQVAIPYDIGNIFNRPVNLGPVSAIVSAFCLLYLLFFGVITSPFGYFFGVPSEKYVLGDAWPIHKEGDEKARIGRVDESNADYNAHPRSLVLPPDFEGHIFSGQLGDELNDVECRKMLICSAHNGLRHFPHQFLKVFQFFSKKLLIISSGYREAILKGIEGEEICEEIFSQCNDSIFGILVRNFVKLMPKWSRKKATRNHFS